jgi:hypothetical protein
LTTVKLLYVVITFLYNQNRRCEQVTSSKWLLVLFIIKVIHIHIETSQKVYCQVFFFCTGMRDTRGCGRRKAEDDVLMRVMGEDGKETKNGRRRWWMDGERRNIWRRIDNDM